MDSFFPQSQIDLQRDRLSTNENEGKTIPVSLIYKNVFVFSAKYAAMTPLTSRRKVC